jgi:large subunit ribosomal protein L3
MTLNLTGKKRGMLHIFTEDGLLIPCTVIEMEPNTLTALMTEETNGYSALQLGFNECKATKLKKPMQGQFAKKNLNAFRNLKETRVESLDGFEVGQQFGVEYFENIPFVDCTAISIGKGFQGVMKKYHFAGGRASHGNSRSHRSLGSTGNRSTPGRCFPGGKRPSRMGFLKTTMQNLKVMRVNKEENIIVVKGSVPGPKNGLVTVAKAVKKH